MERWRESERESEKVERMVRKERYKTGR
jgi:hypothetical protein